MKCPTCKIEVDNKSTRCPRCMTLLKIPKKCEECNGCNLFSLKKCNNKKNSSL